MHPSRAIRGRTSQLLSKRRIILGISGSIAAVEVVRIIRELIRHGADVQAVMSAEATRIITPEAVAFATGHPPVTQLSGAVEHVSFLGPGEDRADLFLIAPATANTISKIAHGIDDTPVTSFASVALGGGVPILIAPAMHAHMGRNPAVQESLDRLRGWGVGVIASQAAEGEEKLATPEEVAAAVLHRLARGPWVGGSVIVIGGASRESIDEVRSITNESSGTFAVALATQAHYRGADVQFWAGALQVPVPTFLSRQSWRGVTDLIELARSHALELSAARAVIVPAALSDFSVSSLPGKISSREHPTLSLKLDRAPKVLPELRRLAPPPVRLVGFKLEADTAPAALEREGRAMLEEAHLDWVIANDAKTLGNLNVNAYVLKRSGGGHWIQGPKAEVAGKIWDDLGREIADIPSTTAVASVSASARTADSQGSRHGSLRRRAARGGRRRARRS
ncbi:MAG: bifunctional phosphopantothenoylcysteine decarboxylase/phosphopantothenate--cysteine ligase CoaBC [Thermoplasmata archaeon]